MTETTSDKNMHAKWDDDERSTSLVSPFTAKREQQSQDAEMDDLLDFGHILRGILKELNKVLTSYSINDTASTNDCFLDPFYCKHVSRSSSLSSQHQESDPEMLCVESDQDDYVDDSFPMDKKADKYMYS